MSVRDRVGARLTGITGSAELDAVEARIASLEVAVAENSALEVPLARLVAELERTVAGVVAGSAGDEVEA